MTCWATTLLFHSNVEHAANFRENSHKEFVSDRKLDVPHEHIELDHRRCKVVLPHHTILVASSTSCLAACIQQWSTVKVEAATISAAQQAGEQQDQEEQVGKAPSWARAPIGADSHDGFCIMHNIIFSADPKRAKMASRKLFLRDS